ncbi:alpha/beta fold hydrolase [Staphylococcus condimenti]|nr:alpha/beta hydrolase [Staphylococcus condimenti]
MQSLETNGAIIRYEQMGQGPLLIMIPGASGVNDSYMDTAEKLKSQFTVVLPDRRGYGYSELTEPMPASINQTHDTFRLEKDTEDMAVLTKKLSDNPVYIMGTDTGAVVAMRMLEKFPDLIAGAAIHEPLNATVFPNRTELEKEARKISQAAEIEGIPAAMRIFEYVMKPSQLDMKVLVEDTIAPCAVCSPDTMDSNSAESTKIWMQYELRQYMDYKVDLGQLRKIAHKIAWLKGKASKGSLAYQASDLFARDTDKEAAEVAGGHFGYVQEPEAFAKDLSSILDK